MHNAAAIVRVDRSVRKCSVSSKFYQSSVEHGLQKVSTLSIMVITMNTTIDFCLYNENFLIKVNVVKPI